MDPAWTPTDRKGRPCLWSVACVLALAAPPCITTARASEVWAPFGGDAATSDAACTQAKPHETSSGQGCIEGYEILPANVRLRVRATVPANYHLVVLGCVTSQACPLVRLTPESVEPPAVAGGMRRFSYLLPKQLPAGVARVCVRQETAVPGFPPPGDPSSAALLGCSDLFRENYAGALRVRTAKEGVALDGWIIDTKNDLPVTVSLRRGNVSVTATADKPDTRSQERWPGFGANHGFSAVFPFVGTGGTRPVCIGIPSQFLVAVKACAQYEETATVYLDERTYTVGDGIPYTLEMADPGARLRFNLFSKAGEFFLLPWKDADIGTATADAQGHASGSLPTDDFPPGDYRLAFVCEAGCSKVQTIPGVSVNLEDGSSHQVALGPSFGIVPPAQASVAVPNPAAGGSRLVVGENLPPSLPVEIVLILGNPFFDGRVLVDSTPATVGADGKLSVSIPAWDLPSGTQLIYVMDANERVLASCVVNN